MATLYYTCGLSGSGKSHWCFENAYIEDVILDSDAIREELWGDAADQRHPDQVFNVMQTRCREALLANKNVYYCSTGLSSRHRVNLIKELRKIIPNLVCNCIIIVAPIEICKERNAARVRVVPEYVIDKQLRSFQIPTPGEGWDEIEVIETDSINHYEIQQTIWMKMKAFGSQQNSHHCLSLFDHCRRCFDFAIDAYDSNLAIAAFWHDCGKIYTQEFWPQKDHDAHYPSHAEVGAYLALCMGFAIHVAQLIGYHMHPYETQAAKVWKQRAGDELWNEVLLLHDCDKRSH